MPNADSQPIADLPGALKGVFIPPSTSNVHIICTQSKAGIFKPKAFVLSASSPASMVEPRSMKEVLATSEWHFVMQHEIAVLHRNNTWTLVPSPPS